MVNDVLNTTDLLVAPPAVPTRVPVAQNIVPMKAQYGIDNTGDGIIDCWTPPDERVWETSAPTPFAASRRYAQPDLAVRIGVVARSDEPDLRLLTDPGNLQLQSDDRAAVGNAPAGRPVQLLREHQCRLPEPGGLTMGGTATGSPTCAPAVVCDYWRYRTYETIVPLRNAIYAASMPP